MAKISEFGDLLDLIFPKEYTLTPGVNELYELRLAQLETKALDAAGLLERSAYFAEIDGAPTTHFQICTGAPLEVARGSSMRLQTFFQANLFKTGYATHGLFPYRGKFHAQMIKALINVMGVEPGETVLDPMMGSGTVLVEAASMGIHSVGFDSSPLCLLMTQAKLDGMSVDPSLIEAVAKKPLELFDALKEGGGPTGDVGADRLLHLAYLDSIGYAARRKGKDARALFKSVLKRYYGAVEKFHAATAGHLDLGSSLPLLGDARQLPLRDGSIQGVIFSPPYSFAVDYVGNDALQLGMMEVDLDELRDRMVGLRGEGASRVELYFEDMGDVMSQISRVLATGRRCCVVVGSNTKQLAKLLGEEQAQGIEDRLVEIGAERNLDLCWRTTRQVTGIANTMREEHILLFEKRS